MAGARVAQDISISAQVVAAGQPEANISLATDARIVRRELLGGVPLASCIPLGAQGQPMGVLWVGHARPLSDEELRLLIAITDIAANALRRATFHEQTQLRADQLAAVNRLGRALAESLDLEQVHHGLAEATAVLLPSARDITLWLLSVAQGELRCAYGVSGGQLIDPATQPVWSMRNVSAGPVQAAASGRAVIVRPDTAGAPHSLCVPMSARGRLVGVIQVAGDERARFSTDDAELLSLVASTAAVAVENAALFAETERRLQRLTGLRAIDQAISSSFDLRVTLNVLLDQVTAQLGVSAAVILLLNPHLRLLEIAAARGLRVTSTQQVRIPLGEGMAGRAALDRRLVRVPDLRSSTATEVPAAYFVDEGFVSYFAMPLAAKGVVKGVLEILHRERLEPDPEWLEYLDTLAGQAAIAIDNVALFDELQRSNADLILAYDATIEGWSRALDLRDKETEGHTERVTEMTLRLARTVGMNDEQLVHVRRGALLHDIGKMGIPDNILLKPGPLTAAEWEVMRRHPAYAYEMLAPIGYLRRALDIPYCHHEKWNGTGYPRGLKGEQIPQSARVFAIADVWDALRSDRPYRKAWPEADVRAFIESQAGAHFDPAIVEIYLSTL
jgi:HD-GYP domain-containing protein (c-di-GMP phosphodiesterase class II)